MGRGDLQKGTQGGWGAATDDDGGAGKEEQGLL